MYYKTVVQLVNQNTVIKTGLEKYCSIKTSHTGVNNMWICRGGGEIYLFFRWVCMSDDPKL